MDLFHLICRVTRLSHLTIALTLKMANCFKGIFCTAVSTETNEGLLEPTLKAGNFIIIYLQTIFAVEQTKYIL